MVEMVFEQVIRDRMLAIAPSLAVFSDHCPFNEGDRPPRTLG
jgi:hypothetical protein